MRSFFNKVLILAPHTDDGEFGCGGAIAKFIDNNCEVFYVAFSSAKKSLPKGLPPNILKKEAIEATASLGIPKKNLFLFNFEVRQFPSFRQRILEKMIKLRDEIMPEVIFLPSTCDTHQDHKVISEEGFRAFKNYTILGYELPWNNLTFTTSCFINLGGDFLQKKVESLKLYKSQAQKHYASEEAIKSLARTRGTQVGCQYAEAFEVIRLFIN